MNLLRKASSTKAELKWLEVKSTSSRRDVKQRGRAGQGWKCLNISYANILLGKPL